MKTPARLLIVVGVIVLVAVGFSLLFSHTKLHYLADAEKGVPRPEVEDFWSLQVPLALGLGGIAVVVILGLLRSAGKKARHE
jgi:hypothetical protein